MKKIILTAACIIMLLCLCACGKKPVPDTYCASLSAAEKMIGFKLTAPENIDNSGTNTFRVSGRTLEVMYFNGKVLTGRISKADNLENINGTDYGYDAVSQLTDNGISYTLRGEEGNDTVNLATWTSGDYSYLVLVGAGKTPEQLVELCKAIK